MRNIPVSKRAKGKVQALRILGGRCRKCGFDDYRALQIDHIIPENSGHHSTQGWTPSAASQRWYRAIKAVFDQDPKHPVVQCLCANCHAIKTYEETH